MVDLAAGYSNRQRNTPVTPETPFLTFSTSKPFTALCIHQLAEQGRLELDAPVATYWPEFGCKGKQNATLRHVLLHQAGVPMRGLYRQIPLWYHWGWITRSVAALEAEYPPGTKTAYHAVNYGFILGEVVRRISGQPVERYLQENFLDPLDMKNTRLFLPWGWIGRAARIYSAHQEQAGAVWLFSRFSIRHSVVPAASLNSTARDLARFYQMLLNGGEMDGRRYVQPETIHRAVALGSEGMDASIGRVMRWAMGFHLGGIFGGNDPALHPFGTKSTQRTFGHSGQGSCVAWADPEASLVLAFTCNLLQSSDVTSQRCAELANAVWDCIHS
jgi:CubicO group peptidase (beta-lactamase class C family)